MKASVESICSIFNSTRAIWEYTSILDDSEVTTKLQECVERNPKRGIDHYFKRIGREGFKWSRNRILSVYRDLRLVRRPRK